MALAWRDLALPAVHLGAALAARDWLVGFLCRRDLAALPRNRAAVGEIESRLIGAEELLADPRPLAALARWPPSPAGSTRAIRRPWPAVPPSG